MICDSLWEIINDDPVWPLIKTNDDIGTICEVRVNFKDSLIKRKFTMESITANGKLPTQHPDLTEKRVTNFFLNEIKWLDILSDCEWIPKTIDYNIDEQWTIQEWHGPDLISYNWKEHRQLLKEQVIEMYKCFVKEYDMLKGNGSLSNMSYDPIRKQIIAFDFKWADNIKWRDTNVANKVSILLEIRSYWKWLSKIDKELPYHLLQILDDQT
tara:strand:- start:2784 stop:3419 length:636 start_codon:yes stop_codon:yes gene_type:complete